MPDKKDAAAAPKQKEKPVSTVSVTVTTGWWHDADHATTAERAAAQRARDEAAGFGPPAD